MIGSEEKARKWLKNQGFSNIEKAEKKGEPDFLADGEKIEVKKPIYPWKISGRRREGATGTIYLTKAQAEKFPDIKPPIVVVDKEHLFTIKEDAENIADNLDNGIILEQLRERYEEEGHPLSKNVSISIGDEQWIIKDENKGYSHEIRKIVEIGEEAGGPIEEFGGVRKNIEISIYGDKIRFIPFEEIGEYYNISVELPDHPRGAIPFEEFGEGNGEESCFIATASFGTPCHPGLNILRNFRDQELKESFFGEKFVKFYYKVSPPIAKLISKSEKLQNISRKIFVEPLIKSLEEK